MSALDPDKIDEIRDALIDAADEITSEHPREAIDALLAVLGNDLSGADGAIIERTIKRLELLIFELSKVEDMLLEAPFSFGKLNDEDAS
jgi:hypothetical protein